MLSSIQTLPSLFPFEGKEGWGAELTTWKKSATAWKGGRHLIRDILKAPEVHCSFIISSLKTTFSARPRAAGVSTPQRGRPEGWGLRVSPGFRCGRSQTYSTPWPCIFKFQSLPWKVQTAFSFSSIIYYRLYCFWPSIENVEAHCCYTRKKRFTPNVIRLSYHIKHKISRNNALFVRYNVKIIS